MESLMRNEEEDTYLQEELIAVHVKDDLPAFAMGKPGRMRRTRRQPGACCRAQVPCPVALVVT